MNEQMDIICVNTGTSIIIKPEGSTTDPQDCDHG